jgi:hypothetical protein
MPREVPAGLAPRSGPKTGQRDHLIDPAALMPWEWASHSRWLRALRLGCSAPASSSDPTWPRGFLSEWYGRPPMVAEPASGASRPTMTRTVVDLSAP